MDTAAQRRREGRHGKAVLSDDIENFSAHICTHLRASPWRVRVLVERHADLSVGSHREKLSMPRHEKRKDVRGQLE